MSKIVKSQIESNSQPLTGTCCRSLGVSKIVKSQIESNSQQDRHKAVAERRVCQRSSNHKLKAIHNNNYRLNEIAAGVSKIVKSQIESNSQPPSEQ